MGPICISYDFILKMGQGKMGLVFQSMKKKGTVFLTFHSMMYKDSVSLFLKTSTNSVSFILKTSTVSVSLFGENTLYLLIPVICKSILSLLDKF